MKKFLNISLVVLVALSSVSLVSCKNETEQIFDEDAVARLEKAKAEYADILVDKGGKWQMEYFANDEEPGYIYVMTFSKDGSVVISGENKWLGTLGSMAYGSATSLWEVIADNGPVLSFNSFNKYFHVFADPEDIPSTDDEADNEQGYGHRGDYEFNLMKYSNDTLYISGKKHGIDMIMTRIDPNYDDKVYMDEVVAMADSFFNAKIPQVYMNLPNGTRWIIKNGATSLLKMFREGDDEISTAVTHNVIITHDGLSFMNPLTIDGFTVQNFIRQADGSLLCRDDNETTITADDLNKVFTIPTFVWKVDTTQVGGAFATQFNTLKNELNDYGKRKLTSVQISYDADNSRYLFVFGCLYQKKTFYPTFYLNVEPVGDDQIKFNFTGEGDAASVVYAEKCPALNSIVGLMNGNTFTLTTSSLLAPVDMKLSDSGNGANYFVCKL